MDTESEKDEEEAQPPAPQAVEVEDPVVVEEPVQEEP